MKAATRHMESQSNRVQSGRGSVRKFSALVLKTATVKHKLKTCSRKTVSYLRSSQNRGLMSHRSRACTRWLCVGDSGAVPKAVFWVAWLASISTNLVASWVQCWRASWWGGPLEEGEKRVEVAVLSIFGSSLENSVRFTFNIKLLLFRCLFYV